MCRLFLLSAALGVWTGSTQSCVRITTEFCHVGLAERWSWGWSAAWSRARAQREEAAHNTQLCKQVLPKQPYRSDATLHNIVTNARLRAVSCLSAPCEACRRGGCCQRGDGARRPCRWAGGQKMCVSAPLSRGG